MRAGDFAKFLSVKKIHHVHPVSSPFKVQTFKVWVLFTFHLAKTPVKKEIKETVWRTYG